MTLLGNIISIPISLLDQTTKREREKNYISYTICCTRKNPSMWNISSSLERGEENRFPYCKGNDPEKNIYNNNKL